MISLVLALSLSIDWKPAAAVMAGRSFDTITTIRHGMRCPEENPTFQRADGSFNVSKAVASDVLFTAGAMALDVFARKTKRRWFIRTTQIASYGLGAWGGRQAVMNIRGCGW